MCIVSLHNSCIFMVFDVKYVHGSTKSNLNNQHDTNELWHFFYFTYLRFLTFFPSFRLVTMAMTNTFSCHTICQKSPTVLGFGPVIIMFRHFISLHIHFFLTFNISDLTHILVSTDLEMQCKLHRRQYSETIVFFLKCTDCYTSKNNNYDKSQ